MQRQACVLYEEERRMTFVALSPPSLSMLTRPYVGEVVPLNHRSHAHAQNRKNPIGLRADLGHDS